VTTGCQALFTNEEKLAECNRELAQRQRVYGWQVRQGRMKASTAALQIRLMTAIRDDYADKAKEGPLFNQIGDRDGV
jgi:hypothetical protein